MALKEIHLATMLTLFVIRSSRSPRLHPITFHYQNREQGVIEYLREWNQFNTTLLGVRTKL